MYFKDGCVEIGAAALGFKLIAGHVSHHAAILAQSHAAGHVAAHSAWDTFSTYTKAASHFGTEAGGLVSLVYVGWWVQDKIHAACCSPENNAIIDLGELPADVQQANQRLASVDDKIVHLNQQVQQLARGSF